ncbi:hypothetical protein LTR37_011579 [Vermiconidia calcicola]|uniref:Uncharacterized protein n=1 Tax=Vermiconidia calcicola TaxID=1690605 RepID=A0ACC3N1Q0_9PEZI|nr:hypothetical protein LTR37_011579 [Vermiconidia calcicola]
MATSKPFDVAIIGYGLSAKVFHIPLICALPNDFNLYGIVQRSPKPDNDASKNHPGIKSWRSVDEVYKDPDVDLVVITSIPETHFSMCKDALEAGKHVVVEKPFVATAKEADELIAIQKKSGKLLTVYQNRRWDSDFLTLRKLISDGTLGGIVEFETHFDRHRPDHPSQDSWKLNESPGHGSIYELGTHLIDQVYCAFGMPKRVTAFLTQQRKGGKEGGVHDSHTVLMHYEGGMVATVKAGVVSVEVEQLRFWVRGTKGSFRKFHLDVQEDQLKDGLRPGDKGFGEDPESHYGTLTTLEDGGPVQRTSPTILPPPTYVEYYRILAKAMKGGGEVPVKAEEARDVLSIIELARQSSEGGRTLSV